jgi:DUF4097 and DUF4098 domain-containing protein YvlB
MPTFNTPEPISAVLDIPAGRVQFIAADRSDTAVEILPADPSKGRDVKVAEEAKVEYGDGVLRIGVVAKNQYFGPSGSVAVTVQLPAGSRVEVKAASAELRAAGRFGDVAVQSEHGSIDLDDVASAHLTTTAGDIRVAEAVRGSIVLRTVAGDVEIGAAAGVSASLDAGTTTGRISNALKNTEGAAAELTIHATTTVGDIVARSL